MLPKKHLEKMTEVIVNLPVVTNKYDKIYKKADKNQQINQ